MKPIKTKVARKAAKTTAKHTANGAASKLKRTPMRSGTLLGLGAAAGFLAGRLLNRGPVAPNPSS